MQDTGEPKQSIGIVGQRHADALTPKQELFAIEYVKQGSATGAYKVAYDASGMKPNTINRASHELTKHEGVAARVVQLREDSTCTIASLSRDLAEDRRLAQSLGQCGAAIQSTSIRAKLHGHLDNKQTSAEGVLVALAGLVQQLDARHQDTPPMPEPPAISSTCERIEE